MGYEISKDHSDPYVYVGHATESPGVLVGRYYSFCLVSKNCRRGARRSDAVKHTSGAVRAIRWDAALHGMYDVTAAVGEQFGMVP